jgi:hypothetical protein
MNDLFFDRIGNWNPQLLRELKGKWKLRTIGVAVAVPLLACILLFFYQWQRMPGNCQELGCAQSWQEWWLEPFRLLHWLIPIGLLGLGSFNLIIDLTQENDRGTLSFIRLSPRSSWTIFWGKIMGVPILTYVSILVLVPIHIISGVMGGVPGTFFVSYYILLLGFAFLVFSAAIIFSLLGSSGVKTAGIQAYGGAIFFVFLTLILIVPLFWNWNLFTTWFDDWRWIMDDNPPLNDRSSVYWWYMALTGNSWLAHGFTIGNLIIASWIIWQILKRRFHHPNSIIISKGLSYICSAYLEIFILGFFFNPHVVVSTSEMQFSINFLYVVNFLLFLALAPACTPQSSGIQEWLNYRNPANLIMDLLWFDKSPSVGSIVINLVITQSLVIAYLFISLQNNTSLIYGLLVTVLLIFQWLFYGLLYQVLLLLPFKKPSLWAVSTLTSLMFVPLIAMTVIGLYPHKARALWLMIAGVWSAIAFDDSVNDFLVAYLGLLGAIGLCSFFLWQRLAKLRVA